MSPAALPPKSLTIVSAPRPPRRRTRSGSSPRPRTADFFTDWDRIASEVMGDPRSETAPDEHDRGLPDPIRQLSTQARRSAPGGPRTTSASATPVKRSRAKASSPQGSRAVVRLTDSPGLAGHRSSSPCTEKSALRVAMIGPDRPGRSRTELAGSGVTYRRAPTDERHKDEGGRGCHHMDRCRPHRESAPVALLYRVPAGAMPAVHDGDPEQRHHAKQDQSALGEGPPVG
jgi:hypothetical protein